MTDLEFEQWLAEENVPRLILVEATYYDGVGSTNTSYFSNYPYITKPTDLLANIAYDDVLSGIPVISTQISGDSSEGFIEVLNTDGEYDYIYLTPYEGYPLRIYLGGIDWSRDDFRLIVDGICENIESQSSNSIRFNLRNRKKLLDIPVQRLRTDTPLFPETDDKLIPIAIGNCFNVTPLLTDVQNLIYTVHESDCIIESVRDNGVELNRIVSGIPVPGEFLDNLNGTLQLGSPAAGTITADIDSTVQVGSINTSTPGEIINWLALRAGIDIAKIDTSNLDQLGVQPLGIYITNDRTISSIVDDIVSTVGAYWRFNRLGVLQAYIMQQATGIPKLNIYADDIEVNGFFISNIAQPRWELSLGYAKNWTVQDISTLAGAVPDIEKELYSSPYSIASVEDTSILDIFPLAETDDILETLFINSVDAYTEANRRLLLRSSKRATYKVKCFSAPLSINVGDVINITHDRFGFENGKLVRVIGILEKPNNDRVELEVWE